MPKRDPSASRSGPDRVFFTVPLKKASDFLNVSERALADEVARAQAGGLLAGDQQR